jgi:hypothetical protein
MFAEIGPIVKPAFVANFSDGLLGVRQQFTGMSKPDFGQKLYVAFFCTFFKCLSTCYPLLENSYPTEN